MAKKLVARLAVQAMKKHLGLQAKKKKKAKKG